MNLNGIAEDLYNEAKNKGWHDKPVAFGDAISNIHAELSEAFEEYRQGKGLNEMYEIDGKPMGIPIEFADVIIRILDNCHMYGIDIDHAMIKKVAYNRTREHKHGGKIV